MSDPSSSNPFAAPQTEPGTQESPAMDDAQLLAILEMECSGMRFWLWTGGIMFVGFSILAFVVFFFVLLGNGPFLGIILNLLLICLHGCAAVLILRCANKLSEFRSLPRPFQFEELMVSHAACWKYLGIVCATLFCLFLLLILMETLMM